jgi:hypothetical protein
MQPPKPSHTTFEALQTDIRRGTIKIPQFQREFVWERYRSAKLLDSILKSYPLGTFILWKTKERLRVVRDIGGMILPPAPEGDYVMQVLDGQQRMTSLFAALEGVTIGNKNFGQICVDLDAAMDGDDPIVYESKEFAPEGHRTVLFKELRSIGFQELMRGGYTEGQIKNIDIYKTRIQTYQFPTVEISDASLAVATEIFTRLNVGGKSLSVFEIMVAKTWDEVAGFDLNEKVDTLNKELITSGYGGIDSTILMQNNAALVLRSIKAVDILAMNKSDFINNWNAASQALKQAVDFCRSNLHIPVRALLPYQRCLIPLSYYFFKAKQDPVGDTKLRLIDLFYRIGLSERYSSAVETKVAQDLRNVDLILDGKGCQFDYGIDVSADFILRNGFFRAGKAYIKTLLCVLAANSPKDFRTRGSVILDNAMLKQKNSRNYHHFFPTTLFRNVFSSSLEPNHVGNITLVSADLNKNKIRAKKPSVYISEFMTANPSIADDLKSHLIDIDTMGVMADNYDTFLPARCKAISQIIQNNLLPNDKDSLAPEILADIDGESELESDDNPEVTDIE